MSESTVNIANETVNTDDVENDAEVTDETAANDVDTDTETEAPSAPSDITPFFAARVVNFRLEAEGIDKTVTPQMMYTYAKKGLIDSNYATRSDGEKIRFDGEAFKTWLTKYVKNDTVAGSVDIETLAAQYL
jgi:hypothetical protein